MPDLLTHYVASFLVAYAYLKRKKTAAILAITGLLPDLDALVLVHRSPTHSILAILVFAVACLLAARLLNVDRRYAILASTLYALHVLMDLFNAPTPILWPISDDAYTLRVRIYASLSASGLVELEPVTRIAVSSGAFRAGPVTGPIVSENGVILGVTVLAFTVLEHISRRE